MCVCVCFCVCVCVCVLQYNITCHSPSLPLNKKCAFICRVRNVFNQLIHCNITLIYFCC